MVYDQAQSSRLGQRAPVESTYVSIVDVDPDTNTANLPESAYPGQLIFRNDLGILQIWSFTADTWIDVGGGVAGQLTYVGEEFPVVVEPNTLSLGDVFYDSDDRYKQYVWDGDSWEPTAAGGILTFRQGNPPPVSVNVGDIWYNSDAKDAMYRAEVAGADFITISADDGDPDAIPPIPPTPAGPPGWTLVKDGSIPAAQDTADAAAAQAATNADTLANLNDSVANLALTMTSTNNTADTADGRVSMSDYNPGDDDLTYEQVRYELDTTDPSNPVQVEVRYQTPRVNGSIWFTRTRPRHNVCTNPSFEVNETDWTFSAGLTHQRAQPAFVPAGVWTEQLTNTGTAPYTCAWGRNRKVSTPEGAIWTASIYAELVSGTGQGLTLRILWYNAAGVNFATSISDPYDLALGAFDPTLIGTVAEPRFSITAQAPVGAVSFFVQHYSPSTNVGDVWYNGALLIEQEDDLGSYFDGDSFDGVWDGVRHNSTSQLNGDKIRYIAELRDGEWISKFLTEDTMALIDVTKLIGQLNADTSVADGTVTQRKLYAAQVLSSEALSAGDVVNVWNNNGVFSVRKANSTAGYPAHGYVVDAVATNTPVSVYSGGVAPETNLVPGAMYLSATGALSNRPATAVGSLVQRVGTAVSSQVLDFYLYPPIRIT